MLAQSSALLSERHLGGSSARRSVDRWDLAWHSWEHMSGRVSAESWEVLPSELQLTAVAARADSLQQDRSDSGNGLSHGRPSEVV